MANINIDLIADIVAKRKQQKVTHATIKRDLNALSSMMNFAVGNRWRRDNPVLAFLTENKQTKLIRERRAPIVLPREQDIALVKARSPAVYAALIDAARKTGAREDELIRAKAEYIDHRHRQLTIVGKRNRQRTIPLNPMAGYKFFTSITACLGSPYLFWHDMGEKYSTFAQQFWRKVNGEIVPYAKVNGIDFRPARSVICGTFTQSNSSSRAQAPSTNCNIAFGHSSITTTEAYLKAGLLTDAEIYWALYRRPMTSEESTAAGAA